MNLLIILLWLRTQCVISFKLTIHQNTCHLQQSLSTSDSKQSEQRLPLVQGSNSIPISEFIKDIDSGKVLMIQEMFYKIEK